MTTTLESIEMSTQLDCSGFQRGQYTSTVYVDCRGGTATQPTDMDTEEAMLFSFGKPLSFELLNLDGYGKLATNSSGFV